MKKRYAVMSFANEKLVGAVASLGLEPVCTAAYGGITDNPEATHADMQILTLPQGEIFLLGGNDEFNDRIARIAGGCNITIADAPAGGFTYPDCVKLNIAVFGGKAIGNFRFADKKLTERLLALGHELIDVKQGYAKCSVCIVSDNAIITADKAVAAAASTHGADTLVISPGGIELCPRYGGFIGGASFLLDGRLFFTGDISLHRDGAAIEAFCKAHGVKTVSLTKDKLFDIGGVVII